MCFGPTEKNELEQLANGEIISRIETIGMDPPNGNNLPKK